ncbi:anti-sigma factor antagonist [Streptomyces sp. NPDC059680]|uniref:anti-sigma factor antagonist n=1 Tax=Streptomyces sp. NPDC059680 TaxID=3346904 RepID=UPI00367D96F6
MHAAMADAPAAVEVPLQDLMINVSPCGGRVLVTLCGELDICTEGALRSALREAVGRGCQGVDLDLTGITFCDCSGLNVLLAARRAALRAGKTLTVRAASRQVRRLLNATGTGSLFVFHRAPYQPSGTALPAAQTQEDALSHEEELRAEVVQLRRAMQTRAVIDQALGVLMASFRLSSEDAWNVLVTVSQNTNIKLHQVAEQLVTTVQGVALADAVQVQVAAAVAAVHAAADVPSDAPRPVEEGEGGG